MKKTIPFLVLMMLAFGLNAQSIERWVIGSGGGSYYDGGSNFEMDYTIGEAVITTISSTNNVLTQGFQQPFKMTYVSVQDYTDNTTQVILYPNPVTDQLNIAVQNAQAGDYRILVFDLLGQLLVDESMSAGFDGAAKMNIDFGRFATGNYYVRLLNDKKIIQTAKIIKINQ